jgi:hypothetical protein
MDGVTLTYGDTVLLKDQGIPEDNGIYTWRGPSLPLVRASGGIDHQISSGMLVPVEEGTVNADKIFMLTTDEPINTGDTPLVFVEFGGGGGGGDAMLAGNNVWTGLNEHQGSPVTFSQMGDIVASLIINDSGTMEWSDGTNASDAKLERNDVGTLRVLPIGAATRAAIQVADAPVDLEDLTNKDYVDNAVSGAGYASLSGYNTWTNYNDYQGYDITMWDAPINLQQTGDVAPRVKLDEFGAISWGDGANSPDTSISRTAPAELTTDGTLKVNNGSIQMAGGPINVYANPGDVNAVVQLNYDAAGSIQWSDGSAPTDTNLYRDSVGMLKTDGSLTVVSELYVNNNVFLGSSNADTVGFFGSGGTNQAAAISVPAIQTGSYVQADVQSIANAVTDIITALQNIGITA